MCNVGLWPSHEFLLIARIQLAALQVYCSGINILRYRMYGGRAELKFIGCIRTYVDTVWNYNRLKGSDMGFIDGTQSCQVSSLYFRQIKNWIYWYIKLSNKFITSPKQSIVAEFANLAWLVSSQGLMFWNHFAVLSNMTIMRKVCLLVLCLGLGWLMLSLPILHK